MLLGAHVPAGKPLKEADLRSAEVIQMFVSSPRSWKAPIERDDAAALQDSPIPIYVHSPFILNMVSPNNRVRIPSRKSLQVTCDAAAAIGAKGVIVHGGHLTDESEDMKVGFERWKKALNALDSEVPILIENTAGGDRAVARRVEAIEKLWDEIGGLGAGFCLDTCHAWAGGEPLNEVVERILAITGKIDLVHCNDSKDEFDSRRDRHENLGDGNIPHDDLVAVLKKANAPIILETPGGLDGHLADMQWLLDELK